jgi:predicted GH43/DUF377 family glycosyl hydrolase
MHIRSLLVFTVSLLLLAIASFPSTSAVATPWVKYAGNPVLVPTEGGWDSDYVTTPRVIFEGNTYRMWYQGSHSGANHIGYATSLNGYTWLKHGIVLSAGNPGDWDSSSIGLGSVLWNGTDYLMWYTGSNGITYPGGSVGFAVSTDGINWVKYAGNPVLTPSGNDQNYIATPYVISLKLTYNMWYSGKGGSSPNVNKILYATSFDGIHWSKWPSPVLTPSTDPMAWDSAGVYSPAVIWNGQIFGLWYSGINQTGLVPRIGFSTSPDGGSWTRSANNPILTPGPPDSWDSSGVEQPSVVQAGGNYMMFYDGYSSLQGQRIGLALAPQGFAIAEFHAPTAELFLGLMTCSTLYMLFYRRRRTRN